MLSRAILIEDSSEVPLSGLGQQKFENRTFTIIRVSRVERARRTEDFDELVPADADLGRKIEQQL